MDKLKKVGLTALGTALVSSSAVAGDLAVTGSAKLTLVGGDKKDTGNGWGMTDSITFAGSADLDNGWTVSTSQNSSAGTHNNTEISIDTGDTGKLTFWKSSGASVVGSWDDMTPSANEESWNGFTSTSGPGNSPVMSQSNADMFRYTVNVMDGLDFSASYSPADGASAIDSSSSMGVQYTGVEGLTIGLAQGENNNQIAVTNSPATIGAGVEIDNTAMYLTYAFDAFTIGVQDNESDADVADGDYTYRAYGLSYAVTEDVSVSYGVGTIDYQKAANDDQETSAVSASYTSGGVTVSATMADAKNLGGSTAAANDRQTYELNISFAF